ncbi:MAG TPA: pilus assembly protein TadG-related protein [Actinomycetota bacterium]|nr:pilus assembly protein TadG-related protein [Actinomycetota bacterium]
MSGGALRSVHRDERGSVGALVIQVAVCVVLAGLVVHDGGQILRAQVKAQSAARAAASEAANEYRHSRNQSRALGAAAEAAVVAESDAKVTKVEFEPDGSATVTVAEPASTIVARHFSFLKGFTTQRASDKESPTR